MDKYHVRRQILDALVFFEPAAAPPSDILAYPPIEMSAISADRIMPELTALAERGYIKNLRPGRDPLFRITVVGRGQINREDELQEFIWGEFASKFQV